MSKILLVDDDPTLLRFLKEYLGNLSYRVSTAASGAEALRLAYREHPHLVVLDVMMPGMDGWSIAARLRELDDLLPIIFLTARDSEEDKLRGFALGVDDYVTKPFSFGELAARIQAIINRVERSAAQPERPAVIPVGDILLDLERREARRGEQVIPLTPTELRLLEALARRQGRAVSESDLMHEIWGEYHPDQTTAVRRYIWLLRKKIEPDPAKPTLILTVRGFGYRLG